MVVNHTVDAGSGRAGIRWYEVRDPNSSPAIHQQGTYAPQDTENRWMGSIAMDKFGNMALGYSVSSALVYPSIRYAGRLNSDTLGILPQGETTLIAGGGSQTHSTGRWGDYSMMSVDPVDDCTFWHTQEYMETTSSAGWKSRIGSFRFPTCGPQQLTVTPSGEGSGSVTGNGIDCAWNGIISSGTCSVNLDYNTAVSLTAYPSIGSTFSGWSGGSGSAAGCSGTGACAFNLAEASGIGSIFTRKSLIYLPLILRP